MGGRNDDGPLLRPGGMQTGFKRELVDVTANHCQLSKVTVTKGGLMTCKHHPTMLEGSREHWTFQSHRSPWKGCVVNLPAISSRRWRWNGQHGFTNGKSCLTWLPSKLPAWRTGEQVWYTFDTVSGSVFNRQELDCRSR